MVPGREKNQTAVLTLQDLQVRPVPYRPGTNTEPSSGTERTPINNMHHLFHSLCSARKQELHHKLHGQLHVHHFFP